MVYSAKSDDANTISQFTRLKYIYVTTNGSSTPANYQVKLTIAYEPEMQADFSDIRFNTLGNVYIDYWIESKTNSVTATVWVELPNTITDPGSDTIWMYYGNGGLSDESSIQDTFYKGDDFSGDLSAWTVVQNDGSLTIDTERMKLAIGTSSVTWWSGTPNAPYAYVSAPAYDYIAVVKLLSWTPNNANKMSIVLFDDLDNAVFNARFRYDPDNYYRVDKVISDTGHDNQGNYASTTTPSLLRIRKVSTTKYYDVSVDGGATWNNVYSSTELTGTYIGLTAGAWTATTLEAYFDDFRVRKYIANAPTPSYGTAQHQRRTPQFIN